MVDTPDLQQNINAHAGRRIVDIHIWAVREGLRGTKPAMLFMGIAKLTDAKTCADNRRAIASHHAA